MINLPTTGLSNDNTNNNYISNDRESDSTIYLHEDETNRKSYPQRHNRAKLNYRDIERGMYEEIRQSMWAVGGPTFMNKNKTRYRDNEEEEEEIIDLSIDDDEKSTDASDQMHRRLWCICKKPWDHSRLMLRCDSCANWYHGDCIGVNKEQAKAFEINSDQFICPSCRGTSHSLTKSSEESIPIKRQRSDGLLPSNNHKVRGNEILSKSISHDESTKKPKTNLFSQHNSLTESRINCIVHGCNNSAKSGWVYCSPACIRRHINDRLQAIQRSKGTDNVDIPNTDDILLYESRNKKILEKNFVPKIEDLCTWINQHPSYEIIKPNLRQSILLTAKQSTRSFSSDINTSKSKFPLTSSAMNQTKSIPKKKNLIQHKKPTNNTPSSINNTADIRSKVPTALYDKIIIRLEKNNEKDFLKHDIRTIVNKIEEEMFRVYGKVDNSYKNKFRSLLANISNMNNNFFYKQILSKKLTAKEIVAMKSEDMLPPEEKEKRKDQFEKEVQMILHAEQQTAEEMARRVKIKVTRQGLVDNDAFHLPIFNLKEQNLSGEEIEKSKDNQLSNISKTESTNLLPDLPSISLIKKIDSNKLPVTEESNPIFSAVDLDNDYIEPESPTGIDALIYDDDDNNDDIHMSSRPSTIHSSVENTELFILPNQQIIRDDYNPSKAKNEIIPISQSTPSIHIPNQWRGVIHSHDMKISCQSVHIYGESNYLIGSIPEQLLILGRLRLGDLWDYIRDSLIVRDVLILTLISSSLNSNDNEIFLQYVNTMYTSGRAAVISKCSNSSLIRDMYILTADTKECPASVLSSLFLPITFESKQLFLVIIGSGKRTIKSINHSNEHQLLNNLIYKPVSLQDSTGTRDPRLLRNKDPRLNKSNTISENITQQTAVQYSNEDLLKLISDSLERIRHSSTSDDIHSIVISTMEILKANQRDDLTTHFNDNLRIVMVEWQTTHENTPISTSTIIAGDNLTEENMDVVDDDQDDKHKKQIITSSNSNSTSEFNDIDYRFLDQDMDHHIKTTDHVNNHRKPRRKSRFSDVLSTDDDRTKKFKSNNSIEKIFSNKEEEKSSDKSINSLLNNKFRPIINSTQTFLPSINIKNNLTSKPIRFSFSKDSLRRYKSNTNPIYDNYQGLSFSNDKYTKQTLPINPIHPTDMLNLIIQQQKTKNRFSLNTNEWRTSNHQNYLTHYHDFDQPSE